MLQDASDPSLAPGELSPPGLGSSPTTAATAATTAITSSSGTVSLISSAYCDWEGRVEPRAARAIPPSPRRSAAEGHTSTDETTDNETETETETEATTTTLETATSTEDETTTEEEEEEEEQETDDDDDDDDDDGYERPDLDEPIYMSVGRHLSLELDAQETPLVTQNKQQAEAVRHHHHERRKSVTLRIDDDFDHDGGDQTNHVAATLVTATATLTTTTTEKVIYSTPPPATRPAAGAASSRDRYGDFDDSSATTISSSGCASPPSAAGSPVGVPRGRSGRRGGVVAVDDLATAAAASAVPSQIDGGGRGGEDPLYSSTDDGYVDYSRGGQQQQQHHGTANAGAVMGDPDLVNVYTELGTDLLRDIRDDELKRRFMHFLSLLPARPERRSLLDKLLRRRSVDGGGDGGDSDQQRAGSVSEYDWPVLVSAGDGGGVVEAQRRSDSSQVTGSRSGSRRAKRKEKKEKRREERRAKRKAKKEKREEKEEKRREKRGKEKGKKRKCSRCEELLVGHVAMEVEKKETEKMQSNSETAVTTAAATMSEEEKAAARRQREERRERKRKEKEEKERSRKNEDRERRRRKREERRERTERKKKREEEKKAVKLKKQKAKAAKAAASEEKPARTRKKLNTIKRETSGLTKKDLNFDRQWNEEYQSVIDKGIEGMTFDDMSKISKLVHDFVYNAETYAKVIINELNVDDKKKTIKPAGVGGVAGGEKFIVQGILFKFCRDPMISASPPLWLYGGWRPVDEYAMKAAGLELQGLGLIANPRLLSYIRHPLMTLIDYKGFRIVATCVLPLGPHTLCYGSNDGGKTVLARDPVFNKAMEKVGKCLNLKKHTVGRQRVPIIGPGDIEGHLGTDGRYYMLDYARLMPPEEPPLGSEEQGDRSVFFKMLRPEIVQKYHSPLSSDAFTGWSKYDLDIAQSEWDIRQATKLLINEAIPALARELDEVDVSDLLQSVTEYQDVDMHKVHLDIVERVNLVYRMHSRGINMRNLGRLRQLVTNPDWKTIILGEATSRCAKQMIKARMRQAMTQSFGVSSESLCKDLVLDHLNNVIGASPGKESYMKHQIKPVLLEKFPGLLTEDEMDPAHDLRSSLPMKLVFILSKRWEILRVTEHVTRKMLADPYCNVRILPNDVQEMVACVKKPPLIHVIDASMYIVEALALECNASEAVRLLETALEHLTTAGDVMPSVPFIMWAIGRVEAEIARRRPFSSETEALLVQAIANHRRALLLEVTDGPTNSLATTLELYAAKLEEAQQQQAQRAPSRGSGSPLVRTSPSSTRRLRRSAAAALTHSATAASPGWTRNNHHHTTSGPPSAEALTDSSSSPSQSSSSSSQQRVRLKSSSRSCPSLVATAATALFASSSSFFSSLSGSRGSLAPAVKIARLRAEAAKLRLLARALANTTNTSAAASAMTTSSDDEQVLTAASARMLNENSLARLLST